MQSVSDRFDELAAGNMRPLSWAFRVSFDKQFASGVTFFTLDTSELDGVDVLASNDSEVIQEWDKYNYADYTDRIIQMEWSREQDVPYSVNLAICDVVLNNYDGYFTRGADSPIDEYLLPRRPMRVLAGFNGENVPQFVGLTEKVPEVNYAARTAKLHAQDFLSSLFNKPLDQTVIYENIYTDEALSELFQLAGLLPGQYVLDSGFNEIKFLYFEKGIKLGSAIRELMQAELGSLYMDELGMIRFRNRVNISTMPVYTFTDENIVDFQVTDESSIINVVEVKSSVREVQERQPIYTANSVIELNDGTNELFFDFEDPITTMDAVEFYQANTEEDGSGSDVTASIDVTATSLFATSVKITFDNTTGSTAYLTDMTLYGTPAKVVKDINLRVQDDDSVEKFEEQPITIENNFIQDDSGATSVALSLLNYYKDYGNTIELEVVGNYALQLDDHIHVLARGIDQIYSITKIVNTLDGKFRQILTGRVFNIPDFFVLDQSILDGEDVLSP